MITISGQFREKEELDQGKPYDMVMEKWETIQKLLWKIDIVSRSMTCAYCRKFTGCTGCPLESCVSGGHWENYIQKLEKCRDATKKMIEHIQNTRKNMTEA